MRIDVREAIRSDADDIATSHIASWRAAYRHIFPAKIFDDPEFDRSRTEMWRAWTHSPGPDRRLVVATLDGAVVGFAHTGNADDAATSGELFGFYTHPDAWGTGVAARLMEAALEHLTSLGHTRAVVWTLSDARRARAFYEKTSWTLTGRDVIWRRYPDHPAVLVEYENVLC